MPQILQIDTHIRAIDHMLLNTPHVGVTYVVRGERLALIETGTSLTVPFTLAGLEALSIRAEEVDCILCTHIHMDHAGGAGYLAAALPRADVYIHSMTGPHLVDPSKLLPSVRRAVGERAWPLHGDILPLPPERLRPAEDLHLDLGQGIVLSAISTPGHAPDHLSYYDSRSGALFIGDAAGVAMTDYDLVRPVTPPPAYDLIAQRATIARLRAMSFSRLLFTHCGPRDDVAGTLARLDDGLEHLVEGVRQAMAAGEDDVAVITERLLPTPPEPHPAHITAESWAQMSIAGLLRYFKRQASQN